MPEGLLNSWGAAPLKAVAFLLPATSNINRNAVKGKKSGWEGGLKN